MPASGKNKAERALPIRAVNALKTKLDFFAYTPTPMPLTGRQVSSVGFFVRFFPCRCVHWNLPATFLESGPICQRGAGTELPDRSAVQLQHCTQEPRDSTEVQYPATCPDRRPIILFDQRSPDIRGVGGPKLAEHSNAAIDGLRRRSELRSSKDSTRWFLSNSTGHYLPSHKVVLRCCQYAGWKYHHGGRLRDDSRLQKSRDWCFDVPRAGCLHFSATWLQQVQRSVPNDPDPRGSAPAGLDLLVAECDNTNAAYHECHRRSWRCLLGET